MDPREIKRAQNRAKMGGSMDLRSIHGNPTLSPPSGHFRGHTYTNQLDAASHIIHIWQNNFFTDITYYNVAKLPMADFVNYFEESLVIAFNIAYRCNPHENIVTFNVRDNF